MIRVNPWVAVRYVSDHHTVRVSASDPLQLRVRECPACGHAKWAVAFHGDRQVFHGFCCDANVAFLDQVRADLGGVSLLEAIRSLGRYGESKFSVDFARHRESGGEDSRLEFLRRRVGEMHGVAGAIPGRGGLDLSLWRCDWAAAESARFREYAERRNVPPWFLHSGRCGWFAPRIRYVAACRSWWCPMGPPSTR